MNLLQKLFISTYLFMDSIAVPILQKQGCCIQYGYGSMMEPCCHKLIDIFNEQGWDGIRILDNVNSKEMRKSLKDNIKM